MARPVPRTRRRDMLGLDAAAVGRLKESKTIS
jgi:hypothetical protein